MKVFLCLGLILPVLLVVWAQAASKAHRVVYECGPEGDISVVYGHDRASLALPGGKTLLLPAITSDSGQEYDDGTVLLWNHGEEAILEWNGEPLPWECTRRREAAVLVVLEVQYDLANPRGKMPADSAQVERMIAVANQASVLFRNSALPVVYVVNERDGLLANLFTNGAVKKGTPGAGFDERLQRVEGPVFSKSSPDAFSNPAFAAWISGRGTRRLFVAGLMAEGGVHATVKAARKAGYEVTVLGDGVAARDGKRLEEFLGLYREYGALVEPLAAVRDVLAE